LRAGLSLGALLAAGAWLVLTVQPPPLEGRQLFGLWRTRDCAMACALVWIAAGLACAAFGRRALFRWLLATLLAAASWLLLELIGLLGLVSYPALLRLEPRAPLGAVRLANVDLRGEASEELAALWGLPGEPVAYRYRTDRRGLRNEPDREAADLYLLGDSFLVAGLLPWPDTVAARLEQALQRPVMNLALVGLGAQEQLDLLREVAVPLQGRLVLQFVFEGNDLVDSARYRRPARPMPLAERSFARALTIWLQRLTQPTPGEARRKMARFDGEEVFFLWDGFSFRGLEGEIEPVLAALGEMHAHVARHGGAHALVLVPSKIRVLGPFCEWPADSLLAEYREHLGPLPARVAAWAKERGVPCLDLTEPLQAAARAGSAPYFARDTHWNALGHEIAARAVAEWAVVRGR
jgi:hypothetical protein